MEFKGTKGKWKICIRHDEMDTPMISVTSQESIIAHCYNLQIADGFQERTRANALLISKAPEMLEMLKYFVENNMLSILGEEMAKQLITEATEI